MNKKILIIPALTFSLAFSSTIPTLSLHTNKDTNKIASSNVLSLDFLNTASAKTNAYSSTNDYDGMAIWTTNFSYSDVGARFVNGAVSAWSAIKATAYLQTKFPKLQAGTVSAIAGGIGGAIGGTSKKYIQVKTYTKWKWVKKYTKAKYYTTAFVYAKSSKGADYKLVKTINEIKTYEVDTNID